MASSLVAPSSTTFFQTKVGSHSLTLPNAKFKASIISFSSLFMPPNTCFFFHPFCPKGLTLHQLTLFFSSYFIFVSQKDLGLSASSSSQRWQKPASRRISCSVAAPQQSQRQPSTTGSVSLPCFFSTLLDLWVVFESLLMIMCCFLWLFFFR